MNRRAAALAAAGIIALIVLVALVLLSDSPRGERRGEEPARTEGGPGRTDREPPPDDGDAPSRPPGVPVPPPPWGDFPGAPPDLAAPPGGSRRVTAVPAGARVVLRRPDGSTLATAHVDEEGAYLEARYFDRAGRLTVVVSATREARGAAGGARARGGVRCGSAARGDAGYRWTRLPIAWRLNFTSPPPRLGAAPALAAMRRARATWGRNRNHCRIPDRSGARFAYRGATPRRTGLDRVSVVEFGDVDRLGGICAGTAACTTTWVSGRRATESDVRIDRDHPAGFFAGATGRRRGFDLESVLVHESGHSLGLAHVLARDVVMFSQLRRGSTSGRRLGRGDALANNAKY